MVEHFIKKLRNEGFTMTEISERSGLTRSYLSNLAKGATPSMETAIKLADAFSVSLDEVIGRTPPEHRREPLTARTTAITI